MEIQQILETVNHLKDELDKLRPLAVEQEQRILQKFRLEWTYHSNAIEGNTLTFGETKAFLLYGITAQGKPFRDYLEIRGHHQALDALTEMLRQQRPLTEADIRELHRIILVEPYDVEAQTADGRSTIRRIHPGQYKTMHNHVRTSTGEMYYYATPEETPAKMGDLMAWYRRELDKGVLHPLILAATFHYQFVAIHPFDDGNGRMARLLMNLILMQAGFPPLIIPLSAKNNYLLALETADANQDIEPFIVFIGEILIQSLDLYLRGAKGERIDELSDLDKKLTLLQKKLEADEKARPVRSPETLLSFNNNFLEPFLSLLFVQMAKFDQFFAKTFFRLTCHYENKAKRTYYGHDSITHEIARAINKGSIPSHIEIIYEWGDFMTDELFHILFTLDIHLRKYSYEIIGFAHSYQSEYMSFATYDEDDDWDIMEALASLKQGKAKTLLKGRYDSVFSEDDLQSLIQRITNQLYKYLEQKADEREKPALIDTKHESSSE